MEKDKIISAYEQMLMTRISLECLNPNDVGKKDVRCYSCRICICVLNTSKY